MDVDPFDGGIKTAGKGRLKPYEVASDSLSQKQIEDLMKQDVDYISSVCGVDVSIGNQHFCCIRYLFECFLFVSLMSLVCS